MPVIETGLVKRALYSVGLSPISVRYERRQHRLVVRLARPLKVVLHLSRGGKVSICDPDTGAKVRLAEIDGLFVSCLCKLNGTVLPQKTVRAIYCDVSSADVGVDMLRRRLRTGGIDPARLFARVRGQGYSLAQHVKFSELEGQFQLQLRAAVDNI